MLQFEANGFFDYCVSEKCLEQDNYETTIKMLYDFGYRTIAINQAIELTDLEPKKKKRKGDTRDTTDPVPEPYKITPVKGCEDMKILNRLTISFLTQDHIQKALKSPTYKRYHIIAVLPMTNQATLYTCTTLEADIFCFNPESKSNIKRTRKILNQLIERGYHFEIPYSPAIEDFTKRKNIINTAHLYHTFGKSRNIIISSDATNNMLIRSPYDIINLGLIFGLSEQQAKSALTHCGRQVYINSVGRRHGKAVMFVENVDAKEVVKNQSINAKPEDEVIQISESDGDEDEMMEVDQPAVKKLKQDNK